MVWTAILLMSSGIICNSLVKVANDGKMPVAMQKADILFVIGPTEFGVKYFPTIDSFDERHRALTEHTRFRILADRIPVSFRFIHPSKLPHWYYEVLKRFRITAGEEGIASIGDLLIWFGILFALPTNLALSIFVVREIFLRIRKKISSA